MSKLSATDALILELAAKVSPLERRASDRHEENARLRGLKRRPQIKPSGVVNATTGKRDRRRGRAR